MPRALVRMDNAYTQSKIIEALRKHLPECELIIPTSNCNINPPGNISDTTTLYWMEYEELPWTALTSPANRTTMHANSYCIRKGLIRKSQQSYIIRKFITKRPQSVLSKTFPETYQMEADHPDYLDEILNELYEVKELLDKNQQLSDGNTVKFIMKPSMTNKGAGIYLFDSVERLESILWDIYGESDSDDSENDDNDSDNDGHALSMVREWIVQRYIDNPLLLGGKKFHIRAYVLAVGNLKVYLFDQMLALFALHSYEDKSLEDTLAHLTNTCLQINDSAFNEHESVMQFWELSERFPDVINKQQLRDVFDQMKLILRDLFEATASEVINFQPLANCFELYGMDFLLDCDKNVFFLEANAFPDFKQTGDRLSGMIQQLFNETVRVAIRPIVLGERTVSNNSMDAACSGDNFGRLHLVFDKQ